MNPAFISIIIMVVCIILFVWDKYPSSLVAIFGCVLMVLFNVCDISTIMSGYCTDILLLLFGMQIIGVAMFKTGASSIIGEIAIKLSKNNERRFIVLACIISAFLSAFLSNTAVIAMMLTICQSAVYLNDKMHIKNLYIPVAIAAILGGQCTLAGSTPQLVASSILGEVSGTTFGMFDLMWVALPITIILIVYMAVIGYPLGNRIWGKRNNDYEILKIGDKKNQEEQNKRKWNKDTIIMCFIFLFIIIAFISGVLNIGIIAVIGALLCFLSGCITAKDTFKELDWNCIIWLCCCLGLGEALNASGGAAIIAEKIFDLIGNNTNPLFIFSVMVFFTMVISQFISNMTALLITLPASLELIMQLGYQPYPFAYGMCLGASLTFATSLANGHIGMTLMGGYKFTDYVKYGTIPNLLAYILIILITPKVFPLM